MVRKFSLLMSMFFGACGLHAQQADFDLLRFYMPDGSPYLEVHVAFGGPGWSAVERGEMWMQESELRIRVFRAGEEVTGRSVVLSSPAEADSAATLELANLHIERLQIPGYGDYRVAVEMRDVAGGEGLVQAAPVDVRWEAPERPMVSDILLVQAYRPDEGQDPGPFSRSGMEMLPAVGGMLAADAQAVRLYAEVYGMDQTGDSLCLLTCSFADASGLPIPGTERLFRRKTAPVLPLFESLPVPAGLRPHAVVVTAETRNRNVIAVNRVPLRLEAAPAAPSAGEASWIRISGPALRRAVEDLYPIAQPTEKGTIDRVLPTAEEAVLRSFVEDFWISRFPDSPGAAWEDYLAALAYVDSAFGACRQGRGARTDMGSVYLRFGPPNTRVRRHNETEYYPYEIWHYHRAGAFTNKRFLFYAPYAVAECFEVLHSDLLGEISNPDWLGQLRNRENTSRVTDTQMNRLNLRKDTYSRSEPEDLFFNPR